MAKQVLKDLINMDYETFINLTKKENINQFKTVLKKMFQASNRRIKTLKDSPIGSYSPALKALRDAGIRGKFNVRFINRATTKDTAKLMRLFNVSQNFLKAKTSRLQGWNAVRDRVKKYAGTDKLFARNYKSKAQARYWTNKEKKFWEMYNKLVDEFGGTITELDSKRIQKMLARIETMRIKGKTDDFIQGTMQTYIDELHRAKTDKRGLNDEEFIERAVRLRFK